MAVREESMNGKFFCRALEKIFILDSNQEPFQDLGIIKCGLQLRLSIFMGNINSNCCPHS